jgi:putative transposase
VPRANRYFIPGYVWHITHRCHKKEFLLRFGHDRRVWLKWLFEAKKRYGLEILNYTVTSNHIHLLVYGGPDRETIPRSMQLVAGRTAQEYNRRKQRKGAFWEDRYHATAIDTDDHLARCLIYIDLNMVRAGVVQHPGMWAHGGHHEILHPPSRYRLLARERLKKLLAVDDEAALGPAYQEWIEEALKTELCREPAWCESIAVGGKGFVGRVKEELGVKAIGRTIRRLQSGMNSLGEPTAAYSPDFGMKNGRLRGENELIWQVYS